MEKRQGGGRPTNKGPASPAADPVWEALQKPEPRDAPLSDEMKRKRARGLREVAARDFVDVYGIPTPER